MLKHVFDEPGAGKNVPEKQGSLKKLRFSGVTYFPTFSVRRNNPKPLSQISYQTDKKSIKEK
jgi:hypothetical protein